SPRVSSKKKQMWAGVISSVEMSSRSLGLLLGFSLSQGRSQPSSCRRISSGSSVRKRMRPCRRTRSGRLETARVRSEGTSKFYRREDGSDWHGPQLLCYLRDLQRSGIAKCYGGIWLCESEVRWLWRSFMVRLESVGTTSGQLAVATSGPFPEVQCTTMQVWRRSLAVGRSDRSTEITFSGSARAAMASTNAGSCG